MLRAVSAVILGYVAIFIGVMGSLIVAAIVMGPDQIFKPEVYEPSLRWILVSFFLGFWAATLGGVVCAAINRKMTTVQILAFLVVLLGVLYALPSLSPGPDPGPRPAGSFDIEMMKHARTPPWVAFANAPLGAAGVWFGGWALLRKLGRRAGTM